MCKRDLLNVLKSVGIAVLTTAVLLFAFTCIAYRQNNPDSVIGIFSYCIIVLSCTAGSAYSVRKAEERPIYSVLLFCILYSILYTVLSLFFNAEAQQILYRIVTVLLSSFFSVLVFFPRKQKQGKALKQFKKYAKK